MKTLVIRVDASIAMGSGHVMRCLTLADKLMKKNFKTIFICRNHQGNMIEYIKSKGYEVRTLSINSYKSTNNQEGKIRYAEWLGTTQEVDVKQTINALIDILDIDLFVIDHYAIGEIWEQHIKHKTKKIMIIDDLADRKHECDILLDQNYYVDMEQRYNGLVGKNCKLLLGPKYALLREEFREARKKAIIRKAPINRILVFLGGSDPDNETIKAIQAVKMLDNEKIIVDVVVGQTNPNKQKIKKYIAYEANYNYHCQVHNMAELMLKADLAIGAGGSATWERCSVGLPTIAVDIANNQRQILIDLHKIGAIIYLGIAKNLSKVEICNVIKNNNNNLLSEISTSAFRLMNEKSFNLIELIGD